MFASLWSLAETTLILSVATLYIAHCPFNKVEESFNTQAIHDFVNIFPNNLPLFNNVSATLVDNPKEISTRDDLAWDHTQFPGVVPRTFVGSLIVAIPMRLAKVLILSAFMSDGITIKDEHDLTAQFILQLASRVTLVAFLTASLSILLKAIHRRYGSEFRAFFLVITISQFHYLFYAGRFIPNTYAAILSNLVLASWIQRQYSRSIIFIAFCVVIFRFDTALFFGWLLLDATLIRRMLPLSKVLLIGLPAGVAALLVTFTIDSIFWGRPIWPEFESFLFNVWQNRSHEWGIQPYFWYVYNCIPRMMLTSVLLPLVGYNSFTRSYLIPVLLFIITYSLLPHKELRFILFIAPWLNLCAASGLMNIKYYVNETYCYLKNYPNQTGRKSTVEGSKRRGEERTSPRSSSITPKLIFMLILVGMLFANLIASYILARISSHNYPGGHAALSLGVKKQLLDKALENLQPNPSDAGRPKSRAAVYVNNLAAQTGVSRFVQVNGVYYSKTPKLDSTTFKSNYDLIYLILEPRELSEYSEKYCLIEDLETKDLTDRWKDANVNRCTFPNQRQMSCSLIESIESFRSVNISGLLKQVREIDSFEKIKRLFEDDKSFIRTRVALNTIRCSIDDE